MGFSFYQQLLGCEQGSGRAPYLVLPQDAHPDAEESCSGYLLLKEPQEFYNMVFGDDDEVISTPDIVHPVIALFDIPELPLRLRNVVCSIVDGVKRLQADTFIVHIA